MKKDYQTYREARAAYDKIVYDKKYLKAIYTTDTGDYKRGHFFRSGHRYEFENELWLDHSGTYHVYENVYVMY